MSSGQEPEVSPGQEPETGSGHEPPEGSGRESAVSRRAPARSRSLGLPGWVALAASFALAAATVALVPRLGDTSTFAPQVGVLLGAAAIVSSVTGAALYFVLRAKLHLGLAAAGCAVAYNVLVAVVKFVLSPLGLYEANRETTFGPFNVGQANGAILTALCVFALYLLVFALLYRSRRRRSLPEAPKTGAGRWVAVTLVGLLLLVGLGGGGVVWFLAGPLSFLTYLGNLATSGIAALVAVALAGATVLAAVALRQAAADARRVADAGLLVSVFWLGLLFLAAYHVLWVIYILVLTTLWPFRVVMPK